MAGCFAYRLIPPRSTFAVDMTEAEAAVMGDHAGYWRDLLERGTAVVFGPVADPAGSWGLAVVEAGSAEDVRALAAGNPAVRWARACARVPGVRAGGAVR